MFGRIAKYLLKVCVGIAVKKKKKNSKTKQSQHKSNMFELGVLCQH